MPKLSIIIPTFNSSKTLAFCIDSIICQIFQDFEVWIIDGVSTDDTLNIIQEYVQKYPFIHYVSELDNGIYDAMNKGIDLSKGEWLYFLGSDDELYDRDVLNRVFITQFKKQFQLENSNISLIFGCVLNTSNGKIYPDFTPNKYELITKTICHQAIFFKKELFVDLGKYSESYLIISDWIFIQKVFFENYLVKGTDLLISKFSGTGTSTTQSSKLEQEWKKHSLNIFKSEKMLFLKWKLYNQLQKILR